ncbi:MAG: formylglycine-generating enzyme family protein [Anaerolineae bacterium]
MIVREQATKKPVGIPEWFAHIPAGEFIYGPEVTYERPELAPLPRPRQTMWLAEFWLARRPVTCREWKLFLDESGFEWPGRWYAIRPGPRGWLRRYGIVPDYPADMADYPMVDVSLADALAYCDWLSARLGLPVTLPTEFQWEKAARGTDGRTYPWGEALPRPDMAWLQPTHTPGFGYLLHNLLRGSRGELARSGWYWRIGAPWPVGRAPQNVSPYGCVDMAGNIWEWTVSLYNSSDPRFHVVKGGSWGYSPGHTTANCRSACSITIPSIHYRAQGTGFRVIINGG